MNPFRSIKEKGEERRQDEGEGERTDELIQLSPEFLFV